MLKSLALAATALVATAILPTSEANAWSHGYGRPAYGHQAHSYHRPTYGHAHVYRPAYVAVPVVQYKPVVTYKYVPAHAVHAKKPAKVEAAPVPAPEAKPEELPPK